ncbi:MAG: DNA topoisomerase [Flavobacterium sp.]
MPPRKYVRNQKKEAAFTKGDAIWLLILESPSKCSKIEGFLGSQYKCIASNGHIRTIDGLKSIDTDNDYSPKFSIIPTKQDHVNQMRSIIGEFSKTNIILATDDDREGEAIAWHICDTFGLPTETTHRIIFREITQSAICSAIQNKRTINMDLVYAQFARQILDVLVGFRISPVLWKYLYNNKENGLSAGRCQTPALRLVYDNEQDKKNGGSITKTHKLVARFFSKNLEFNLSRELDDNTIEEFLLKSMNFKHILNIGSPKDITKDPPVPLNTSRLLQVASNQLRLSPRDTMSLCQVLYQEGYITYMRTENTKYSKDFLDVARSHITTTYGEPYVGKLDCLENKNENNPHEAIRVTHLDVCVLPKTHEGKIASLYKLIWLTTLESCMSCFRSTVVECRITAPDDLNYSHSIEIPKFSGWRKLTQLCDADEANGLLFYMKSIKDPEVRYNAIESRISFHNIHSHYTESSLIKKLEDLGVGRPSTFASIVDTIQERGYVKKRELEGSKFSCTEYKLENGKIERRLVEKTAGNEKDKLVIEPIGITIIEFLIENFGPLFSYGYTSSMEARLDAVSQSDWHAICNECDDTIKAMIVPIKKASYKIDESHDIIFTKNGPVIRDNKSSELISINKDIKLDVERLKAGEYELTELAQQSSRVIGEWEGSELSILNGRYGIYAQWGENKKNLSFIKKPFAELSMEDVSAQLSKSDKTESNVLRVLNQDFSVRTGKYGPYVYYKRANMAKPEFYNIKKFKESFTYCKPEILIQWVRDTYKMCD